MKKTITILIILSLIASSGAFGTQNQESAISSPQPAEQADLSLLFNNVVVHLRDGKMLSGLLVGIENTTLVVQVAGEPVKLPLKNLEKVVIEKERDRKRYAFYGMFLGVYLGNFLALNAKGHPTAYAQRLTSEGFLLWNLILAGAGGGLGLLVGLSTSKGTSKFEFSGKTEDQFKEWEQLKKFILNAQPKPKKFHLSIQAARSYINALKSNSNTLEQMGYDISRYVYDESGGGDEASYFNLLRKLQLTYRINSFFETGVAVMWLGEPSYEASKYTNRGSSRVQQALSTTGYYAIGVADPLNRLSQGKVSWKVGLGLGLANVNFRTKWAYRSYYPDYLTGENELSTTRSSFSGTAFTELSFHFDRTMALGLVADYVYLPDEHIPEFPEAGLPAQSVRLSHGSIGILLSMHF